VKAGQLLDLLAEKHSDDLFVPECKDGPTQFGNHFRLDAWAMKKSWAHPKLTGYEIKVSRSDWLQDQKIQAYLRLCNELWIVAAHGVVQPEELPETVGLMVPASTGSRLLTKRRASYRQIEPPVDLLLYVLMCRTRVQRGGHVDESRAERAARWKALLEDEKSFQKLGWMVSKRLKEETIDKVQAAERAVKQSEQQLAQLQRAADVLKELGINWESTWNIERAIKAKLVPPQVEELRTLFRQGLAVLETK